VLHDAEKDVSSPTHEMTRTHAVLRARRRIASAELGWAYVGVGPRRAPGRAGEGEDADPGKALARDVIAVVAGPDRERRKCVGNRAFPGETCRRSLRPERALIKTPAEHREGRTAIIRSRHPGPGRPEYATSGHSPSP